jgi:hypothetical protein
MPRAASQLVLASTLTALLAGCGNADKMIAEASVESALQTSRSTGITKVVVDDARPDSGCLDPVAAAAEAAARPSAGLYPEGCATKTADGATVHAELDDCTGPFGRVHLDGGLDAELSATSCEQLHANIFDAGDLTANDAPLEYSASADITASETQRFVDWTGRVALTTKRGQEVEQTSDLSVVVDVADDCLSIDGTAAGHVDSVEYDVNLEGLRVCPGACPARGRVGVHAEGRRREASLSIEFDGSSTATVTGTDGDVFTVEMVCNDDEA